MVHDQHSLRHRIIAHFHIATTDQQTVGYAVLRLVNHATYAEAHREEYLLEVVQAHVFLMEKIFLARRHVSSIRQQERKLMHGV